MGPGGRFHGQRSPGLVRVMQGMQARVPDWRRHGAHEDRTPRALQGETWLDSARSRDRLFAALRALGGELGAGCQSALLFNEIFNRFFSQTRPAEMAPRHL